MTASGLTPALAATRAQRALVGVLVAFTGLAWWSSVHQMAGMDGGPWTGLGSFGWFLGLWTVMMAAMMLPSAIPAVALYGSLAKNRTPLSGLVFAAGYLVVWAASGIFAFGVAAVGSRAAHGVLAWERGGRWAAGTTLLVAAAYQLTPFKNACLTKCRSPLLFLLGSWRPGQLGALRLGITTGTWCVGCCWALMACLFALGVMSIAWMGLLAALVAVEKTLPWRRTGSWTTAAILLTLGSLLLLAPDHVPWLTLPGAGSMPMGG